MNNQKPEAFLTHRLAACVALMMLPALNMTPPAVSALIVAIGLAVGVKLAKYPSSQVSVWYQPILLVVAISAIHTGYRSMLGVEQAAALLFISVCLKLIYFTRRSQAVYISGLLYLVGIGIFLQDQSLLTTILVVAILLYQIRILMLLEDSSDLNQSWWELFLRLSSLFLRVSPLFILLFVLFPRLSTTLLPSLASPTEALTGFSNEIAPGTVARLIESDALAFKSSFAAKPELEALYWRGLTLDESLGLRFRQKQKLSQIVISPQSIASATPLDATRVILEPRFGKVIFSLADANVSYSAPVARSQRIAKKSDGNFEYLADAKAKTSYFLQYSHPSGAPPASIENLKSYLETPFAPPPELKSWLEDHAPQAANGSASQVRTSIENYFAERNFVYSTTPPLPPSNESAQAFSHFLFTSRAGYCEHFAAASVLLARFLKLPARVVIGFQGGEWNQANSLVLIRDYDAHAWAEVFVPSEARWIRVDPVRVVAPERLTLGARVFFKSDLANLAWLGITDTKHWLARWVNSVQITYDNISIAWEMFLLNYNWERQRELAESLGFSVGSRHWWWLILVVIIGLAVKFQWLASSNSIKTSPIELNARRSMNRVIRHLAPLYGEKIPTIGWQDYFEQNVAPRQHEFNNLSALKSYFALFMKLYYSVPESPTRLTDKVNAADRRRLLADFQQLERQLIKDIKRLHK